MIVYIKYIYVYMYILYTHILFFYPLYLLLSYVYIYHMLSYYQHVIRLHGNRRATGGFQFENESLLLRGHPGISKTLDNSRHSLDFMKKCQLSIRMT